MALAVAYKTNIAIKAETKNPENKPGTSSPCFDRVLAGVRGVFTVYGGISGDINKHDVIS